jgi:hypothetical protein
MPGLPKDPKGEDSMNRTLALASSILFLTSIAYGKGEKPESNAFDRTEYLQGTPSGQRKAAPTLKESLRFDSDQRAIEFLDAKGATALRVNYDSIKSILYEQTSTPSFVDAVLISPLFLFSSSKKHLLTIQYTDDGGAAEYAIFHLDKSNAPEAIAAAGAQTAKKVERVEQK